MFSNLILIENKIPTHQNLWFEIKGVLRGKIIVPNTLKRKKNLNNHKEIKSKNFSALQFILMICGLIVCSVLIYKIDVLLNGTAPLLDTLSLSIAIIANLLCAMCYKEQWILWFILDVIQTILYFIIGQPIMAVMYIAWTINCIYGWYNWNKSNKEKYKAQS